MVMIFVRVYCLANILYLFRWEAYLSCNYLPLFDLTCLQIFDLLGALGQGRKNMPRKHCEICWWIALLVLSNKVSSDAPHSLLDSRQPPNPTFFSLSTNDRQPRAPDLGRPNHMHLLHLLNTPLVPGTPDHSNNGDRPRQGVCGR